MECYSKYN